MKHCKDCKHIRTDWLDWFMPGEFSTCASPALGVVDRVTGKLNIAKEYCDLNRGYGKCGPDATLWEAK